MSLEEFAQQLKKYVNSLMRERNEATRADRFRDFIRRTFPEVEVGSVRGYYPELEKYLKWVGVGQVLKGKADSLFGSLLLEFEPTLDTPHEEEAKEQLRRYISIIWSIQAERGQPYERLTAIATDGLSFIVFKPRSLISKGPVSVDKILLEEIDRVNISKLNPEDAYTWLKRYIITAAVELRPVDPDEFARKFGIGSEIFNDVFRILKKGWGKAKEEFATLYEQWEAHLRIVYGVAVGSEELYIRHTYLATLAKLIVYSAYSGGALPLSREELSQILDGSIFRKWRIVNFIEEDLFSWVHNVEEGLEASLLLSSSLAHYDLTTVTLDVFKEVYQGLVDPEARHELGEYYTPDWLAEMIVGDVLSNNPYQSVLDPACGSGTFLAAAIAFKKQHIKDLKPAELLVHILENVVGMDVHPLAVMISRATYLITLGRELLEYREQDIVIPVYLSDSLRLPEVVGSTYGSEKIYTIRADGLTLGLPARIAENPTVADATVDALRDYAKEVSSGIEDDFDYFKSFMTSRVPSLAGFDSEAVFRPLHRTAQNMITLIKKKRDTIWGFILKNYYRPIFISKKKFDAIIGNPPWLSYRYVKSTEYQRFLKQLIVEKYGLLPSDKVELMTHMELATLFLFRCADLYMKNDGIISFVMPRSIMVADQHHNFRTGNLKFKLAIIRLIDLEEVSPLFNVPACVVSCRIGIDTAYPVEGRLISGRLPKRNLGYHKAMELMEKNVRVKFELGQAGERSYLVQVGAKPPTLAPGKSAYFEAFRQGATIVPKSAWFVDIKPHPKLGLDPRIPFVKTSSKAIKKAKEAYKDVELSGNIEAEFLYAVLSGSELVPFGHLDPLVAVLPIKQVKTGRYIIIQRSDARKEGYVNLEKWLSKVEKLWEEKRGEKAKAMSIYNWLDYQRKLTSQNPSKRFKVLYNTSGTYLVSCVAENGFRTLRINGMKIRLNGLVAEAKTYWYETNDEDEAHYLSSILNSPFLDAAIKPMQSRGALGPRDIHKKPLEFPIPLYNPDDPTHRKLAELSKQCHKKVKDILPALVQKYDNIGKIRSQVKKILEKEIRQIDILVRKLLKF